MKPAYQPPTGLINQEYQKEYEEEELLLQALRDVCDDSDSADSDDGGYEDEEKAFMRLAREKKVINYLRSNTVRIWALRYRRG